MVRPASQVAHTPVIAVIGNPNTGKSTLFNALTGLKQKTANYPGVTVERHTGELRTPQGQLDLVDLPGAYSLAAQSPDEMIAVDVLLGHVEDLEQPSAILAVVDATNLRRNLFLVTQLAEVGLPVVVALNMTDLAAQQDISIDHETLARELGMAVVPIVASTGANLDELRSVMYRAASGSPPARPNLLPTVDAAVQSLHHRLRATGSHLAEYEIERALIDAGGVAERRFEFSTPPEFTQELADLRSRLSTGSSLAAMEAKARYDFIGTLVTKVERRAPPRLTFADRLDRITNQPLIGSLLFLLVMATVFQAVFSWSGPLMDLIDAGAAAIGAAITASLPPGALASLLVDGVIAGVGSVVIFLPQIVILFTFIIFLEDSGYMPRAAFMMDRLMRSVGLSGQSFIPMLSSFACAVPGILATRVIPDERDRLATILAAPFMTCSARLPVYALLIAAFVPEQSYLGGLINLQGLVLFALYLLGILGGVLTAWLLKRTVLHGPTPTFLIELPPYRLPSLQSLLLRLLDRARTFLYRAGTVIFTVAVLIWALAYFPRPVEISDRFAADRTQAEASLSGDDLDTALTAINGRESAAFLEQSLLGRMGKTIEPVFAPLGWDWKVSAAVLASFPAREVVIAVLGTIYAVEDAEADEASLVGRLRASKHPDGTPVFTLPMVAGLLVFYAFCLQCAATVAVIARETNGWRWPAFAWFYMTGVGYVGALFAYRVLS
ncbi:MAG: ferrous iron transport protein B [Gammaproteobacteria bacterium]|nr:ferrous iron transport protein B [Gammaproteobacteria bacterium]